MVIDRIAQTVLESFEESSIILTIADRQGCYVSNNIDVFETVFADPRMLDELCKKIDDGCEPLTTRINGYLVACSAIKNVGYAIMLVPNYSDNLAGAYNDFVEIVLSQISMIAERILPECESSRFDYDFELLAGVPLN